ncbi:hypothetical protein T12_7571 [Trichinella patagoniensis]|uniref:Uncharacterized protein n=1 Tax=Trichinella patagoniensis TaxID=990121 RepID=A0A0V0Z2X8_9BILA|nr:hypothetical protein T12_7571 [Trichinella patagoniensis]
MDVRITASPFSRSSVMLRSALAEAISITKSNAKSAMLAANHVC